MGVVIVDNEYESSAAMFVEIINEVLELSQNFSGELQYLAENGFCDVLIDNAIMDKSAKVNAAMAKFEEAAQDISASLKGFIKEADETDSYLY